MPTPSFNKLATCTAILLSSPTIDTDTGKRGKRSARIEFSCTPPDTMDASAILGFGIQNPHSTWVIYVEGDYKFTKSDEIEIDGKRYKIRNIRVFPSYRKSNNTSYEIVIEVPEGDIPDDG